MTISYIIEGAKGTGKSTLCNKLAQLENTQYVEHFSGERTPHNEYLFELSKSQHKFIFDRFFLSYTIYGFAQDAYQHFEIQQTSTALSLETWSPLSRKDFVEMLNHIDKKLVILYSSNHQQLKERLHYRAKYQNKDFTQAELDAVQLSNKMFQAYALILQEIDRIENNSQSSKVIAIDIADDPTTDEIIEQITSS